MTYPAQRFRDLLCVTLQALLVCACLSTPAAAQQVEEPAVDEHPLMPVLRIAEDRLKRIDANIQDYSATLVKRERVRNELTPNHYMFVKVRHNPFSVYAVFLGPQEFKGREVIYVEGQNNGKMFAHEGSGLRARFGMVSLKPDSPIAMEGQRYPLTMIGMRTMVVRLMEVGREDLRFDEVDVKFHEGATINGRTCSCIQAVHPIPRKHFRYHLARIFIDDELQMPIRFEAYLWPYKDGGKPMLVEQYTYLNVKVNQGFTDKDFDPHNENYKFVKRNRR